MCRKVLITTKCIAIRYSRQETTRSSVMALAPSILHPNCRYIAIPREAFVNEVVNADRRAWIVWAEQPRLKLRRGAVAPHTGDERVIGSPYCAQKSAVTAPTCQLWFLIYLQPGSFPRSKNLSIFLHPGLWTEDVRPIRCKHLLCTVC